ncbi:YkgJ family cysteine cluster protein [Paraglaciecola sp.]|uniref:YkgJ family cysteine cluster protein n=1 Tax=Paraglaciecola sp. TaxID=1920173 RepID=UPI00273D27F5|nr:YkgJ family cysteine cluster protein [Paraglaciecola sp.]MDP5029576.1 YkgJ family cysteine cluster protein [Paraglaciecola sp.]
MKECTQCGKCCTKYSDGGLSATDDEIAMWQLFRPDVAEYVKAGLIWMNPQSGKQLSLCPFLRKVPEQNIYTCDIYYDRPDDCKFYPVTIKQMIGDECEMLEDDDLKHPEKAQKTLDKIMADSRPAFDK